MERKLSLRVCLNRQVGSLDVHGDAWNWLVGVVQHYAAYDSLRRVSWNHPRCYEGCGKPKVSGEVRGYDVVIEAIFRPQCQHSEDATIRVRFDDYGSLAADVAASPCDCERDHDAFETIVTSVGYYCDKRLLKRLARNTCLTEARIHVNLIGKDGLACCREDSRSREAYSYRFDPVVARARTTAERPVHARYAVGIGLSGHRLRFLRAVAERAIVVHDLEDDGFADGGVAVDISKHDNQRLR